MHLMPSSTKVEAIVSQFGPQSKALILSKDSIAAIKCSIVPSRCEANAEDFAILEQVDCDRHRSFTDLASNSEDMDA